MAANIRSGLVALFCLGLLVLSAPASAQTCTGEAQSPEVAAADAFVLSRWDCTSPTGQELQWFTAFYMVTGGWDDYGLQDNNACNLARPLTRTYNALFLVNYGSPPYSVGTGRLLSGWDFVRNKLGKLTFGCVDSDGALASHWRGNLFRDEETKVYRPFWSNYYPISRAGTLVHEARHNDLSHDAGSNCLRGASCDSSWSYNGANRYQVEWLSDWHLGGLHATTDMQAEAKARLTLILDRAFQSTPNLKHVDGVGLRNRCYPDCPPPPACADYGFCGNYPNCFNCQSGCLLKSQATVAPTLEGQDAQESTKAGTTKAPSAEMLPPEC